MINKYILLSLFIVLLTTISLTRASTSEELSGCQPKVTLDTSAENNFNFGKTDEVVLLVGTCSQLKSGACGTGTCEKGWKCMDTGIQCLCSPPQ